MKNWIRKNFPLDTKVKMLQAFAYIGLIVGLITYWSWTWFIAGLGAGWFLWLAGTSSFSCSCLSAHLERGRNSRSLLSKNRY